MAVSASLVKELRERTSAPMMECKKALDATNGDIEQAIEAMRKSGQAKAVKKAGRVTAEGVVVLSKNDHGNSAAMIEINCETDFVARDENFTAFVNEVSALCLTEGVQETASLNELTMANGKTVEVARQDLVSKIGENIQLRRMASMQTDNVLGCYLHGGRIGVLVELAAGDAELAKDIAMHVAASKPEVVSSDQVPQELIDEEKRIFVDQAKESGKPEEIIEKMVSGRIRKFVDEISLTGQPFIKDPSMSVGQLLKSKDATVQSFIRFEVGEGIEKQESDFREEVMAQVKGTE